MKRKTLGDAVGPIAGIGVHSGMEITVELAPAEIGEGLWLHRSDLGTRIALHLDNALDIPNCTAIGNGPADATLFVEHLMAALHVLGVTDLIVEVSGPEIPLLDGSSLPWFELLADAEWVESEEEIEPLVVGAEIRIEGEGKHMIARPAPLAEFAYDLAYDHPMIGRETVAAGIEPPRFIAEVAPARTFALIEEIGQMTQAGMLKGGSEENCLIVYPDHYSEPPGVVNPFAKHKVVDMVGDFYLLGRPVLGQIAGTRTGHADNRAMLGKIVEG